MCCAGDWCWLLAISPFTESGSSVTPASLRDHTLIFILHGWTFWHLIYLLSILAFLFHYATWKNSVWYYHKNMKLFYYLIWSKAVFAHLRLWYGWYDEPRAMWLYTVYLWCVSWLGGLNRSHWWHADTFLHNSSSQLSPMQVFAMKKYEVHVDNI